MESKLLAVLKNKVQAGDRVNFRDRRGHYASGVLSCLRDQYWALTGVPETNPADYIGSMKMLIGSAIEKGVVDAVLSKLALSGIALLGTQVAVGGSNPDVNGYLDALLAWKEGEEEKRFVIELKTKSGYGADLLFEKPEASPEYLAQIGLYLKDLTEKKVTNRGALLYVLMSDRHFGEMVLIHCHYDAKTGLVTAESFEATDGRNGPVGQRMDMNKISQRLLELDEHVANKVEPKPDYRYKYPLTQEVLSDMSDAKLKKLIEGSLVYGDWQPLYSRYKNKQLAVDGLSPERTEEEKTLVRQEYRRRHPRSKL